MGGGDAAGATKGSADAPDAANRLHTIVKEDLDKAIALARAEGKKVLINFTGVT